MKTWMTAWTIGAALAAATTTSAREGAPLLTVTARVDDYVNVPLKELAEAEDYATATYRRAGLNLIWKQGVAAGSSGADSDVFDVRVVILPKDVSEAKCRSDHVTEDAMGMAMDTATEASGRIAYIFHHRIRQMILRSRRNSIRNGLGHVIAHEIGHLLLGVNSHSLQGLMRARWDPADMHGQTFTASQVLTILKRFSTNPNS